MIGKTQDIKDALESMVSCGRVFQFKTIIRVWVGSAPCSARCSSRQVSRRLGARRRGTADPRGVIGVLGGLGA
jgi:hypothetical protein